MSEDIGYFAKHACEQVGLTTATLRRWSQTMESCGYKFEKNAQSQRIYYEKELTILRDLKKLVDRGQPVEAAANYLINGVEIKREQAPSDQAVNERAESERSRSIEIENKLNTVLERLEQQEAFNERLVEHLAEQQRYIKESIERRDQQLLAAIRESQEAKRLAAPAEEERAPEPEKARGFFARLFGN